MSLQLKKRKGTLPEDAKDHSFEEKKKITYQRKQNF